MRIPTQRRSHWSDALHAGARGLVAAMAMSGLRTFTSNLELLRESPPEAIVERHGPQRLHNLAPGHKKAVTELAHWMYGVAGGIAFGLLPPRVRAHPLTGPAYGTAVWAGFELGIGPLLGVEGRQGKLVGRAMLVADHALYGAMVAGQFAPEPQIPRRRRL